MLAAGGQSLGQKNTVLAVWMAQSFLEPDLLDRPHGVYRLAELRELVSDMEKGPREMNRAGRTVYPILLMVCATHLLNDMMQSVIPAVYPLLKEKFGFTFAQIGLITLVFQLTSSLLQPVAGRLADLHPRPYSLAAGMCFTLCGLLRARRRSRLRA